MKNILITGATSFVGRNLAERLLRDGGWKVFAVVRREFDPKRLPRVVGCAGRMEVCELDMEEYDQIPEKLPVPFDACAALAWNGTRGTARDDRRRQMDNYKYSMMCVKAVCRLGCRKILLAGSQAEYGVMHGITTEQSDCIPNTEYGKAKLRLYQEASRWCLDHGVSLIEPRFFSLYGEDDDPDTMVLSMLRAMLKNEPCRLTRCTQAWDFLHIEDAVQGLLLLLEKECADGAYNFASGDCRELKEFVEEMRQAAQSESLMEYGSVPYPITGMVNMYPCVDKLQEETGWKAEIPFSEGIRRMIKSMEKTEDEKDISACSNL